MLTAFRESETCLPSRTRPDAARRPRSSSPPPVSEPVATPGEFASATAAANGSIAVHGMIGYLKIENAVDVRESVGIVVREEQGH